MEVDAAGLEVGVELETTGVYPLPKSGTRSLFLVSILDARLDSIAR